MHLPKRTPDRISVLILVLFLIIGLPVMGYAQEFQCTVQLNSDQVQGTNKSVFTTLQKSISEFVNNRRWTELTFGTDEKIECSMNIVVKKVDGEIFNAEITIQSRRPVYNSNYFTNLINHKDNDFNFQYKEFDILEVNDNTITSNLTAVISYYLYVILGMDLDSYSRFGGTPYFQKAEQIVSMAQSMDISGWKAFESNRNRYALINNLTDDTFRKFREYIYEYHRLGLDEMSENAVNGRARILKGLSLIRDANRARPNSALVPAFMDTKSDELFQILQDASSEEKKASVQMITDINPSLSGKFETLLQ